MNQNTRKNTVRKVAAVSNCVRVKAARKHSAKSFVHTVHCLILTVLVTVGLTPFSATPSYAWAPDLEPVLSDGEWYIRPLLQKADGSWYEGTYSIGVNDHGAAWHNDVITYSANNPIYLQKSPNIKNNQGRTTYHLSDNGGATWLTMFRCITNKNGSIMTGSRLVGCGGGLDYDPAEFIAFEFIEDDYAAANKYIVKMWQGARGSSPYLVGLEEGYTTNSDDCHLTTVPDTAPYMWVLTKK